MLSSVTPSPNTASQSRPDRPVPTRPASSQLNNTKDVENRMTLLHYLAEVVEKKHPELLTFMDEISHVERAAKVGLWV